MKISEIIQNIEQKFDTKDLKYREVNLWLEFRNRFFYSLSIGKESNLVINSALYLTVLKSFFYGFFYWFKSYDSWVFSSSLYRVKVEDKYFDKFFDYPAEKYGKSLFIELSTKAHYQRKNIYSKFIVSRSPLIILEKIISIFISLKKVDLSIIQDIQAEYGTSINPSYSAKKIISQYKVMKILLFFKKTPKTVFIAPAYMSFGYVKALKEKKVKVVEVQHGVINQEHFGYNYYESFDANYFPDYLLTFGGQEKEVFNELNTYISKDNIIPVGSYYIDYIIKNYQPTIDVSGYRLVFSVSLQDCVIGNKLMSFLVAISETNKDCLFLLKPRRTEVSVYNDKFEFPSNVMFVENKDVYQVILHSDFHITAYSSCALEAPAMGVKNILINIDNKAKDYYFNILNEETTHYLNTEQDFQDYINNVVVTKKSVVKSEHKKILKSNYQNNVDEFLEKFLE